MSHSRTHILALHGFSSYGQDWHFCTSVSLNQDFPVFKTMCKIYPWQRICLNCAKFQTVEQFNFTNWCSALEEKDCWFNQLSLFSLLVLVIAIIQKEGTLQCPWFDLSAMRNDCRRFLLVSPGGWSKVRPKLVVICNIPDQAYLIHVYVVSARYLHWKQLTLLKWVTIQDEIVLLWGHP